MAGENCNYKIDPLKLVREGTSQDERLFQALDPAYAPVNERTPAHSMVFAQSLTAFLHYFHLNNTIIGTWQPFFAQDVSVLLATAAVQDIDSYRQQIKVYFDFLNDLDNENKGPELKDHLGYLFSSIATLADQLDRLSQALPDAFPIKKTLQNLIQTQLAPAFKKIMLYYRDGVKDLPPPAPIPALSYLNEEALPSKFSIFGKPVEKFKDIRQRGLSTHWIIADSATNWKDYISNLDKFAQYPHTGIYGTGNTLFKRVNHIATHNLFRTTFDQFLKAYARIIQDAKVALEATFTNYDQHQPHYALFLAFLRLMEHARSEMNTLTGRHLDFYYKEVLQLKEKPAESGHAHLLVTLAKHAATHELKQNELFNAGKDHLGKDAFFDNDRDFVANQAKVGALKTIYRHKKESNESEKWRDDRFFASPIANSADGLGEELISADQSWHPFFNKIYANGLLDDLKMPTAELGFAVSSYHLFLTEGYRIITLQFELNKPVIHLFLTAKIFITIEDDWYSLEKTFSISGSVANLSFSLNADAPAIRPYNAKIHGSGFATSDPVVKVLLSHSKILYDYKNWENVIVKKCEVSVSAGYSNEGNPDEPGLKSLQISNDFGQVDTSQPFQPFGAIPIKGASLIIGNKEVFQKSNVEIQLDLTWKDLPDSAGNIDYDNVPSPIAPNVSLYRLLKSAWVKRSNLEIFKNIQAQVQVPEMDSIQLLVNPTISSFDYTPGEYYSVEKTSGYLKLALNADFGHKAWQEALTVHLLKVARRLIPADQALPKAPYTPLIEAISLRYSAKSVPIPLNSQSKSIEGAKFFHIYPFGIAEQHPSLSGNNETFLFPQFKHANVDDKKIPAGQIVTHEAEFFIGITSLKPPQNLALLFQVVDGTADPLSAKPVPHLHWSYLKHNEWEAFTKDQVEDQTGELTRSGIVTLTIPRNANNDNSLLPGGMHWIRIAVEKESDTICHLQMVAAQALRATFRNQKNDPNFPAKVLPAGTISKLDQPDADVKSIEQPFATFGGRGQETPAVFYTRVSERLRHKDRSIALWDYERLVLEAFPQLYKAKCLNHTQYEPSESGNGIYRELAAGHVTLVTIPNQQFHNLKDPLKPYTSLGLLLEVEAFLKKRLSCFVKLHVKNPQFEEVQTKFQVRFFTGYDESFYTKKLQQEITRFLSPWAYGGASPSFGGKIYKSVLINFIEDRPYVDYITDFQVFHTYIDFSVSPSKKVSSENLNEVEGSTAISILVSVPESKHIIAVLNPAAEESAREKCPCES